MKHGQEGLLSVLFVVSLEQLPEIMRKREARTEDAEQGEGRRRADARQGRQRSHAASGPPNVFQYFWELL